MKENQHIEWKESWRDEYLKWISGFANAEGAVFVIKEPAVLGSDLSRDCSLKALPELPQDPLQPRRWLRLPAQGCDALGATLGSGDIPRATPKVLRPYPYALNARPNGHNPVGVETPPVSANPGLLGDSRALGCKTEHLWCSGIGNGQRTGRIRLV